MWEQSLCESGAHVRGRSVVFLAASATAQMLLLALAVILPLTRSAWMPYFAPPLPLAVPAPAAPVRAVRVPPGHFRVLAAASEQPLEPPERAVSVMTPAAMTVPGMLVPGAIAGPVGALGLPATSLAPPPAPTPAANAPVARGGEVEAALCLACPPPAYPAFAREAHVEGTVVLQAVIGTDGRVAELRVVSGPALLAGAARRAVQGWRYRPLVLDGRTVAVACEITVRFKLN